MQRILGAALVILSAVGFGTLAILGRYAYAEGMNTPTLLFLRFSLSALVMAGILASRRESLPRGWTLVRLIGMGAVGYVGQSFLYLTAIQYASAGLVAMLLYLYPTFVSVLATFFLKSKMTPLKTTALILASLGVALAVNPQGGQGIGILLALGAAVIYAVYIIVGTGVMQKVSAFQSSTVIFASAGMMYAIMALLTGPRWPATGTGWLVVGGVALIATVIPVVSFLAGLKLIGPTDASMLSTIEPIVTVILAALLLNETLQPLGLLGGGLILLAVLLITRAEWRASMG